MTSYTKSRSTPVSDEGVWERAGNASEPCRGETDGWKGAGVGWPAPGHAGSCISVLVAHRLVRRFATARGLSAAQRIAPQRPRTQRKEHQSRKEQRTRHPGQL